MPFDPSTAKPADSGFDPSTAKPAEPVGHGATGDFSISDEEGLSFLDRVAYDRMSNDFEKFQFLQNRFGKENAGMEWGEGGKPNLWFSEGGQKKSAEGGGTMKKAGARLFADSPELGGMVAGAAAAAPFAEASLAVPVAGPAIAVAIEAGGAAIGAGGARKLEETHKRKAGEQIVPEGGEEARVRSSAQAGAMGQSIGSVVAKGAGAMLRGGYVPDWFTGATKELKATARNLYREGAYPSTASVAPKLTKFHRTEVSATKELGPFTKREKANQTWLTDQLVSMLGKMGIPQKEAEAVIADHKAARGALSLVEAGNRVKQTMQAATETLMKRVDNALASVHGDISARMDRFSKMLNVAEEGDLGVKLADGVRNERKALSQAFKRPYEVIYSMLGETRFISRDPMRIVVKPIVDRMMADNLPIPMIMKRVLADDTKYLTLQEAQELRSELGNMRFARDLTPGVERHQWGEIEDALDATIDHAGRNPILIEQPEVITTHKTGGPNYGLSDLGGAKTTFVNPPPLAVDGRAAVTALNEVNKVYRQQIAKFKDALFNKLVSQVKSGMAPDPQIIARQVVHEGNATRIAQLRQIVGENVWMRVQQAHFNDMVKAIVAKGQVDGSSLLDRILGVGRPVMEATYGKQGYRDLFDMARDMAVANDSVPAELASNGIKPMVDAWHTARQIHNDFMTKNFLSELADPKMTPEAALDWVLDPKQSSHLIEFYKTFGEGPAVDNIRSHFLNNFLRYTLTLTKHDYTPEAGSDVPLLKFLDKYPSQVQKILLPAGNAAATRTLVHHIQFAFAKAGDPSLAGMSTGAVMEKPMLQRWHLQLMKAIARFFQTHPNTMQWMMIGFRDNKNIDAAQEMVENVVRFVKQEQYKQGLDYSEAQAENQQLQPQVAAQ